MALFTEELSTAPWHGSQWDVALKLVNTVHDCSWIAALLQPAAPLMSSYPNHPLMGFTQSLPGLLFAGFTCMERLERKIRVSTLCSWALWGCHQDFEPGLENGKCPQVYSVNINNNIGYLEKPLHLKWFTSWERIALILLCLSPIKWRYWYSLLLAKFS